MRRKPPEGPAATNDVGGATASLLREGLALALVTVLLYLTAGAYTFGYQDQFGFAYLSLGLEDLVISSRPIIMQIVLAPLFLVLVWALLRAFIPKFSMSLAHTMFLGLPIVVILAFWITTFRWSDLLLFNIEIYLTLGGYYLIEAAFWAARLGRPKAFEAIARYGNTLRFVEVVAGSLALLLLAFNLGVAQAVNQRSYAFCPRVADIDGVLVQMTDNILICAETDISKRLVYSRFRYLQLNETPGGVVLDERPYAPRCIGLPRNEREWDGEQRKNCG